jgi:hypothetical protein
VTPADGYRLFKIYYFMLAPWSPLLDPSCLIPSAKCQMVFLALT